MNRLAWFASALLLGAAGAVTAAPAAGRIAEGTLLPEATLHGLNGLSLPLSSFRGKPLIINMWASWCGPCRQEWESLERLAWRDTGTRFAIIGISTDDDPQAALAWLRATHATLGQFIDQGLQMEHMLGADRLPLTVLVSADGRVLRRVYGARDWDSEESRRMIEAAFRR